MQRILSGEFQVIGKMMFQQINAQTIVLLGLLVPWQAVYRTMVICIGNDRANAQLGNSTERLPACRILLILESFDQNVSLQRAVR